ncbi:MAG: hypothetical protein ACI8ZM_003781 [Crocinitomix sp.]|jgi:hypothetical protein
MKKIIILTALSLSASFSNAQLLDETFDIGLPVGWTQWSDAEIIWESDPSLGIDGTGCAITDRPLALFGLTSGWLHTPIMDLTTVSDPQITFSTALVKNSMEGIGIPEVSLWYDTGAGWTFITNWGNSDVIGGAENGIVTTENIGSPVESDNIIWVDISYDLSDFGDFSSIRFSFGGDFPIYAAGWVLIDDVTIMGSGDDVGINDSETNSLELSIYPNPSTGTVFIEKGEFEIANLKISNALGQNMTELVNVNQSDIIELDFGGLEKGIYFISFVDKQAAKHTVRLIIE